MLGLLGNSLVIYVVLRFSKMHTVKPLNIKIIDIVLLIYVFETITYLR